MRTILAICLLTASFAMIPTGEAVCDPQPGTPFVCVDSFGYGTCENGYAFNGVSASHYAAPDSYNAGAGTYCSGYPGWYEYSSVGAGASHCNYSTWTCESAAVGWYDYNGYCNTYVYLYGAGQYEYEQLGCPAGGPPAVPRVLP